MMTRNRRRSKRIPVGFYVDQFVDDAPYRCFTTDLSTVGLYMERVAAPLERRSRVVQLAFQLPHTSDFIWARGEVVYDRIDALSHGTAVRFAAMAGRQWQLLRDWLEGSPCADRFVERHPFRWAVRVRRPGRAP